MKFNSQSWADAYKESLNNNPNYEKSAKDWEGALILQFISEGKKLTEDARLWLDLWHGKCRDARFVESDDEMEHEYKISAKESVWIDLINDAIDPTQAMMLGKFKISGNTSKIMRYPRAAAYIIKYLKRLLSEWKDDV